VTAPGVAGSRLRTVIARVDAVEAAALGAVVASLAAWSLALGRVDLSAISDVGLVTALPPLLLTAVAVITLSFALVVTLRPHAEWLVWIHLLALIVMLFAITAIVEPEPRFTVAWRHVGIIENLTRTGVVDPKIDAYFSWPGFFALGAFLTQALGLSSALDLTPWAPLVFNLMYLPAVVMLLRTATTDSRVIWVGCWLFFIGDWIGQDYFSPQGFDYFVYILVLAILLTWFRSAPAGDGRLARWFQPVDEPPRPRLSGFQRTALLSIVVLLFTTTVYSHQLTPFAILGLTGLLVILRRLSAQGLPTLMAVVLGTWLSYMTVTYLGGHIASLISRIGNVDTTVAANLTERVRGSNLHVIVIFVRLLNTATLFGLAALGGLRRLLTNRRDLTWPLLALAPFGLLLLQDYGGEMLLRVYLFSLPFTAFLAAHALVAWSGRRERLLRAAPVALAALVLVAGFFVSRFGNERQDLVTVDESTGMHQLYKVAPKDSLLVSASGNIFWKFTDYELYHYRSVTPAVLTFNVPAIVDLMRSEPGRPAYLILSRSQAAALELQSGMSDAEWQRFEQMIANDPALRLVYLNPDVRIYQLVPGTTA
jgi:hypothetical protein